MTSRSALFSDPFSWQEALSSPDLLHNHFPGNVERGKWGSGLISTVPRWRRGPGPVGKKPGLLVSCGGEGAGAEVVPWAEVPQPAGNSFLLPGRPGGVHNPLVIGFGTDPALPPNSSRAQGYHRGTGQCREDHHSLPAVSDSRMGRGLGLPTRLTGIWTNHRSLFLGLLVAGRTDRRSEGVTFLKQGPLSSVASRPGVRILLGMSKPTAPRHLPAVPAEAGCGLKTVQT